MCHLSQPAWANSAALLNPPIPGSAASSPKLPCFPLPPPLILHSLCKNVGYLGCGFSGILFAGSIFLGRHKLSQVQVIVLKYCTATPQRRLSYIIVFLAMTSFLFQKKCWPRDFWGLHIFFQILVSWKVQAPTARLLLAQEPHSQPAWSYCCHFSNQLLAINDSTVPVWAYSKTISL